MKMCFVHYKNYSHSESPSFLGLQFSIITQETFCPTLICQLAVWEHIGRRTTLESEGNKFELSSAPDCLSALIRVF